MNLKNRLRPSDGYTMVFVMMVLLIGTIVSVAAWTTANGDIRPTAESIDDKRAYAAAEAGVADYMQKLGTDNEYWLKCTNVARLPDGSVAPVNQAWNGTGADPRVWRSMPSRANLAYTIELIPLSPYTSCQQNVDASMLDSSGTIRIRTTGRSGPAGTKAQRRRSIVSTLRRNGFLDFLYFTKYEESDPAMKELGLGGAIVKNCAPNQTCAVDDIVTWAAQPSTCDKYIRQGRDSVTYPGSSSTDGGRTWNWAPVTCGTIQFLGTDVNNGPLHSNDEISLCGQPTFGRNRAGALTQPVDRIEYYSYDQTCSGGGPNNGNNKVVTGDAMPILDLPQSNTQLKSTAQSGGLVYYGQTTITLNGTTMTVVNNGTTYSNISLPANGLIYVDNSTSTTCPRWSVRFPYASGQSGCGDAIVQGTYGKSLTIAAARDVRISGDITGTGNSLLGLIANNYVRVEHRVQSYPCDSSTAETVSGSQTRTIQAAILSLGHVFTVDNYQCGEPLGDLNVTGAIAQKYRGPVGTHSGSTIVTGYRKVYTYDDRLKYRSPPYFLAPVQSAWRVVRSTEQVPPR